MITDLMQPGQLFAERYRIERFLARGGFGAVYVAEQLATELRVALKVLWPHVLASADAVEKFKQEARIAGRVNSDHIVRVIDAGFDAATNMPFLVMELLQGGDLQKLVAERGPLPPEVVALYLRQTGSALDKAHGFRDKEGRPTPIIHRDLKPENLFLTHREDGTAHIKVLDFGIAKVLSDATKASQQVKGTPLFMASEQAAGEPISPATDVWALGLIAFFLLTGRIYWRAGSIEGSGIAQLFGEVLSLPLVRPSQRIAEMGWPSALPPGFDAWFVRCVNRDPRSRFTSAGEAARALSAALGCDDGGDRASLVTPASVSTPPSLAPAPPSVPAIAAVTPSKLASSVEVSNRPLGGTHLALGGSQQIPTRRSPVPVVLGVLLAVALVAGAAVWARAPAATSGATRPSAAASPSAETRPPPAESAAPPPLSSAVPQIEPGPTTSTPAPRSPALPPGPAKPAPPPLPPSITKPAAATPPPGKGKDVYNER
jgi:serine/threonine-protein kinase